MAIEFSVAPFSHIFACTPIERIVRLEGVKGRLLCEGVEKIRSRNIRMTFLVVCAYYFFAVCQHLVHYATQILYFNCSMLNG